jgi:uncharacterized surface protein with fasciclin (FAS1) repeats
VPFLSIAKANAGTIQYLSDPANVDVLTQVLTYHVTTPAACVSNICNNRIDGGINGGQRLPTLEGTSVPVAVLTGDSLASLLPDDIELPGLFLPNLFPLVGIGGFALPFTILGLPMATDGASIDTADIQVLGGIVQTVGSVLVPPSLNLMSDTLGTIQNPKGDFLEYKKLLDQATTVNLQDPDIMYTIVTPSDESFGKRPKGETAYVVANAAQAVVDYNIATGKNTIAGLLETGGGNLGNMVVTVQTLNGRPTLFIDGVRVVGEVESTNGNVLEVEGPVYPQSLTLPTNSVLEVARREGFELFATLLEASGNTLDTEGPFTVFAVADQVLLDAVALNPDLLDEEGMPSEALTQILQNHVVRDPPNALLPYGETYYKDTSYGVSCAGIAVQTDLFAVTIADFCQPRSLETIQGSQLGTVSEGNAALLPCLVQTPQCADLSGLPDLVEDPLKKEYFIGCIVTENCIDPNDIIGGIQRCIPIRGGGVCSSTVSTNPTTLFVCIGAAVAPEPNVDALVQCLLDNTKLDPDWVTLLGSVQICLNDEDKCGGRDLYVEPSNPKAAWTGVDPVGADSFLSNFRSIMRTSAAPVHRAENVVGFGVSNLPATNGVVHEVDGVLIPSSFYEDESSDLPASELNKYIIAMAGITAFVGALSGAMFLYRAKFSKAPTDGLYDDKKDNNAGSPLIVGPRDDDA